MTPIEKKQEELIEVLYGQVVDLSMMSKIELGDDVAAKIRSLTNEITQLNFDYFENTLSFDFSALEFTDPSNNRYK